MGGRQSVGLLLALALAVATGGCGSGDTGATPSVTVTAPTSGAATTSNGEQRFPDVVAVDLRRSDDRWQVAATLSSPYDGPDRYADAFRVLAPDGAVLGVRELTHDHANEQPFTRTLEVDIPDGITEVTVEGRDQQYGWGGGTTTVEVPR
jgi:hypothetical protein